ncbi:FliH/SctL family protein [Sphingomonas jeddahensis]|uniref:Flagellar assembly protein H n=1 Tax=Sphingomonas jeddahensis TaxID=1915074 RepID=A0A1V2EX73_9SPHN|nr:FliH/SctL family protein [Sphingomonas jeddahensis]ONF96789.1 flagellar assembly protein H [Sphingomonas jeddahensis]
MSEAAANVFVAGFAPRQDDAAVRLQRVFAERPSGFAPGDLIARIEEAFSAAPKAQVPPEPEPPTLDPVAAAMAEAPALDPLVEAHQAGYDAGYAAARAEIDAQAARDLALLEAVAASLKSDERVDRERIARQLRQTVLHLVTRLVGETGVSADLLAGRVEAASDLLADASESAILRVSPADVALLEERLPETIFAIGDPNLARGSFVLEAASTIVEDGPELWLEQLTRALDKVAVPAA